MSKINRWFVGFFLAVLWPGSLALYAEEPPPDAAFPQSAVSPAIEEAAPGINSAVQEAQEQVRDPFEVAPSFEAGAPAAAPGGVSEAAIKADLQGIGFGSKDAYAVIGGEIFYQGDEKKGIKLLEVRKREVDILLNGGKVTVSLFPDRDLQNAKDRAEKKSAAEKTSADPLSKTTSSLSKEEQPPS